MEILLDQIGKRFREQWVFRHLNLQLQTGDTLALLGPNGSGKSTLLQIMAGLLRPSEGQLHITDQQSGTLSPEQYIAQVSFTAPYLELPEELPLRELIKHHFRFRKARPTTQIEMLPTQWLLGGEENRSVSEYSSGMKQRVKLGLALCTESAVVLLDEPLTNLDDKGRDWYYDLINQHRRDRILIVASNRSEEYVFCEKTLTMQAKFS
ncbi:MAG: ATP-binding cassette domain-containing protein [Saprospiraceae bacterium]|nr:ATP-binding cassette domain-containing protein [Saprospiraceae bacterium]